MSEEKPTFKVTDRRLFNADGTPREDVERPAEPATEATTPAVETPPASVSSREAAPAEESADAATAQAAQSASSAATRPAQADDATAGGGSRAGRPEPHSGGEADEAAAGDLNAFGELVMALAQPAAMALGMIDHPAMAGRDPDPALAKHYIDLLGTLQQKTSGNLSPQEEQLLLGLLTELRMQYVAISKARPGGVVGARGFTGSDITGGR